MSLPVSSEITCGYCGHTKTFMDWASTNSFGSPDLDTRPAGDYRTAINQILVKRCENCGYCNADIEKCPDNIDSIINSTEYQNQLNNDLFPVKANEFLCKSIILESNKEIENAAWTALHAAWNCDDNEKYVQSKKCRNRAIELFELANNASVLSFEKLGELSLLFIDLYRRTEQFDKAEKLCSLRLTQENDDLFSQILTFQNHLISQQEVKAYKIDDATKYFEENQAEDEIEEDYHDDFDYSEPDYYDEPDYERDYFDAMTDGQLGDYDDFRDGGGNIDDIDTWARG